MSYEPPAVRMVHDGKGGYGPEPDLNQSWTDLEKLRWHCALVEWETGIHLRIGPAKYTIGGILQPRCFSIAMKYKRGGTHVSESSGPYSYGDAWTYLNGINAGARAVGGSGMERGSEGGGV